MVTNEATSAQASDGRKETILVGKWSSAEQSDDSACPSPLAGAKRSTHCHAPCTFVTAGHQWRPVAVEHNAEDCERSQLRVLFSPISTRPKVLPSICCSATTWKLRAAA
ncbi:uncharacterized protein Tco025E_10241 [Trypanosoma conorhini]|uniref:Uncharacterized protein n=1 Tax=Trypanosoma conorhini TaxID=83891 RepID=A0A422MP60_9TRYP|nr:uncharacterized protein Tco025E_10241 [Trypanosoma conorhini]RNE95008.1 hypothetical protein Tco025E_10241 [Trypanosoma conorhini]